MLVLRRSILTEKVARRGYHLSREYAIDPLEILFVREVMRTSVAALPADAPYRRAAPLAARRSVARPPAPLSGDRRRARQLVGVVTRGDLQALADAAPDDAGAPLAAILKTTPIVAYPDEPLRVIVYRMAETGLTRFPVVERGATGAWSG